MGLPCLYGLYGIGVQCPITWCWYFLGMYIGDDDPEDQSLCVVGHSIPNEQEL